MNVLASALFKLVVDESVDFTAFADSGAVSIPMPFARSVRQNRTCRLARIDYVFQLQIGEATFGDDFYGYLMAIRHIRRFNTRHCSRFNDVGRMRMSSVDHRLLHSVGSEDGPFLDIDGRRGSRGIEFAYVRCSCSSVLWTSQAAQFRMALSSEGNDTRSCSSTVFMHSTSSVGRSIASWFQ